MPSPYTDIDIQYPQNPWAAVETKERAPWYFPQLYREYTRRSMYNKFVSTQFNHNGPRATELVVTSLLMPHANHDPIGLRQQWADTSYMDSFERRIRFSRYGGKMSLNRYDDLITFWELDGVRGLQRIISEGLGHMITKSMDKLARDAFFRSPYAMFNGDGSGSSFNDLATNKPVTRGLLQQMRLGMKERDVPVAVDPNGGQGETIFCITSPGVLFDLRQEAYNSVKNDSFVEVMKYTNPRMALAGETGMMDGVRFIENNDATLFNAGPIVAQTTVTVPISVGDGSPDPTTTDVDGVERVGQAAATHFITVAAVTDLAVGDRVTIHVQRTSANGVTNGLDYTDGKAIDRRIVAIDGVAKTISFNRPIMEDFKIALTAGVYAYVTKATNVHTMTFLGGRDGVAMGVAQPPIIRMPRTIDDFEMIQRVSYDMYLGYQPFNQNAFEVVYLTGANREIGSVYRR